MKPHLDQLVARWKAASQFVPEDYFISAKETAPLNYYREAAHLVLKQYDSSSPNPEVIKEDVVWFTNPTPDSKLEAVMDRLKLNWTPRGEEFSLSVLLYLPPNSTRPKSFDDISPFIQNWTSGYRLSLDSVAKNQRLEAPLRLETSPGNDFAECEISIPKVMLEHLSLTLTLTNKSGHMVDGVDILPLKLLPKSWIQI